jgi:hypothetical protein
MWWSSVALMQIGGEGRNELRQGLDFLGEVWAQADLNPDREAKSRRRRQSVQPHGSV